MWRLSFSLTKPDLCPRPCDGLSLSLHGIELDHLELCDYPGSNCLSFAAVATCAFTCELPKFSLRQLARSPFVPVISAGDIYCGVRSRVMLLNEVYCHCSCEFPHDVSVFTHGVESFSYLPSSEQKIFASSGRTERPLC